MKLAQLLLCAFALIGTASVVGADEKFEVEKERTKLREWLADKHADIGDDYKALGFNKDARKHYDRARALEPDHRGAMKGLGLKKRGGEWVEDESLPQDDSVDVKEAAELRKEPDADRNETYQDCARRCRKLMEEAESKGDKRAAAIVAIDLLYYEPDNADARALRGHQKLDEVWVPAVAKKWREVGKVVAENAGFGEEKTVEDEQAELIGTTFRRRESLHLIVRTSHDNTRAKFMHRYAEANMTRAMELLGSESPLGGNRYTLTHLATDDEYEAMLTKVLKLEGDDLEFAQKLIGYNQNDPWGYINRSSTDTGSNDMLGNTIALRVLAYAQAGRRSRAPWVTTGFGYFVTSQVLGTTQTQRYSLIKSGTTGTSHEVIPEFTKKSGTPELLREVALYNVDFDRDVALTELIATKTNDMTQSHAAKSFSFIEWAYAEHPEKAKAWLTGGGSKDIKERTTALETHFGKSLGEIETEWREWVLLRY